MNVIQFQARKENRSDLDQGLPKSQCQPSVISFPDNSSCSNGISEEQREKALAKLLKEAEELDQA